MAKVCKLVVSHRLRTWGVGRTGICRRLSGIRRAIECRRQKRIGGQSSNVDRIHRDMRLGKQVHGLFDLVNVAGVCGSGVAQVDPWKDTEWKGSRQPDQALASRDRGEVARELAKRVHCEPCFRIEVTAAPQGSLLLHSARCVEHSFCRRAESAVSREQFPGPLSQPCNRLLIQLVLGLSGGVTQQSLLSLRCPNEQAFIRSKSLDHLERL